VTGTDPFAVLDRIELRERVAAALQTFLNPDTTLLAPVGPEPTELLEAVRRFVLHGGKRIRPAFCFWGWRGAGGADCAAIVQAAASLELLHACALVHDDVMDASDLRRGRPAVHRDFAARHRDAVWRGTAETFGTAAAVLLGDLCLIWADVMLTTCELDDTALQRARPVYDEMRVELMAGQYLDLVEQSRGTGSLAAALRVARYKSAKYTIERPLHLGGTLAGARPELLDGYSRYGLPLGEAFQLRDDVLGVFGDPDLTGKPAGDDLREGKRTVLVAVALDRASPSQAALIERHLGDPGLADDGVAALQTVFEETGALAHAERLIDELLARALEALHRLPGTALDGEARDVLAELAVTVTARGR